MSICKHIRRYRLWRRVAQAQSFHRSADAVCCHLLSPVVACCRLFLQSYLSGCWASPRDTMTPAVSRRTDSRTAELALRIARVIDLRARPPTRGPHAVQLPRGSRNVGGYCELPPHASHASHASHVTSTHPGTVSCASRTEVCRTGAARGRSREGQHACQLNI